MGDEDFQAGRVLTGGLAEEVAVDRRMVDDLESFYAKLAGGDVDGLLAMFSGEPRVNTPLAGQVTGEEPFRAFAAEQREWLGLWKARAGSFSSVVAEDRVVLELTLHLVLETGEVDLPVAMVADAAREKAADVRVYHSTYPLTGGHIVRKPMLEPRTDLAEPPVIKRYMKALADGDTGSTMALFAPDAYIREPSGDRFKHQGTAGLLGFYEPAFKDGGIPLEHCSATFDGRTFAVEFTVDRWGRTEFATMAGMAVYQLAGDGDRIEAVRIYDDVTPPGQ